MRIQSYRGFAGFTLASLLLLCQPISLSAAENSTNSVQPKISLEMMTTPNEVPGTRAIEAGLYEEGIVKSLDALPLNSTKQKAAAYANLCIGYLKTNRFEEAEVYCELGAKTRAYSWIGYINRGTLRYMQGDYISSLTDFSRALEMKPYGRVPRNNLKTAQLKVAELTSQPQQLASE